jgi:carbamoylphosphate synthase large subunit
LGAIFPYGPHEDVVRAFDKVALAEAAQRAGLAVPESAGAEEVPVVVKPRQTTVHDPHGGPLRLRAELKVTPAEAKARVDYLEAVGAEPLVQRYVEGDLVAQVVVTDRDSRVVAAVQQRASSTTPLGGTARGETEALDPSLAEGVAALLADLNWFGMAQIQFQVPPGGEPVLIDLNGRFYGSLALALAAGLNLPAIWAALAAGRPIPPIEPARIGVRYHWLESDLRRAVKERSGFAGTLRYALGARHGIWDARDPGPGLLHAGRLSGRALRRVLRPERARRRSGPAGREA